MRAKFYTVSGHSSLSGTLGYVERCMSKRQHPVRSLEGSDGIMKYGPNTEKIAEILKRASEISPEQRTKIRDNWTSSRSFVWYETWTKIMILNKELHPIRHEVWSTVREMRRGETSYAVLVVVRGAVLGLLAQDKISQKDFDILYAPWKEMMES